MKVNGDALKVELALLTASMTLAVRIGVPVPMVSPRDTS